MSPPTHPGTHPGLRHPDFLAHTGAVSGFVGDDDASETSPLARFAEAVLTVIGVAVAVFVIAYGLMVAVP